MKSPKATPVKPSNVTVEKFYTDHAGPLGLKLLTGGGSLNRLIQEPTVNRPGLALAGFRRYFANKRVQVLGAVETSYLRSMEQDLRRQRYNELFRYKIPCVVLCRGIRPEPEFLIAADDRGVPVFQTELVTMKFISQATLALEQLFAPRTQIHGCMVDIQGIGVIIQGESGIGKSEAVLGLLERGHSLVCDDIVCLTVADGKELFGTGKTITRNLMEVRGIGIIDVAALFGVAAIRAEKRVDLAVTLKVWEKAGEIDRLGLDQGYANYLGIDIPHMDLPVRPGRDIARVIEVAALHTKLKLSGVNPAEDLQRRLILQMNPRL
ncbi:MAG: HPr(Ser) kinase/phosphatase [Pedosphaera sp.]|nr:HPr(Ser) kinase/phosphatase [Pedosphaera sp.]